MGTNNEELTKYWLLIKKITAWKVKSTDHKDFVDDIVQEAFLKLFKQGFFDKQKFETEEDHKMITSYISRTVSSCYLDQLKALGINRRLTKAEATASGNKYENIKNDQIEDICESEIALSPIENPEQYAFVKEAYEWVKECYRTLIIKISDNNRKIFFKAAFWEFNNYDMPLKVLAGHLGYTSSNPTQELKRFVEKVSMCTQPHGVTLNNPHEQIEFLREQIESAEVKL